MMNGGDKFLGAGGGSVRPESYWGGVNREVNAQIEGNAVRGGRVEARPRGGGSRVPTLFGVIVAGFIAAAASGFMMVSPRRPLLPSLREVWADAVVGEEESWGLPSMEELERRASPFLEYGKKEIADFVRRRHERTFPRDGTIGDDVLTTMGQMLSGGKNNSLVGTTIRLKDLQKLGSDVVDGGEHEFLVKKYLGEDSWSIYVEVVDRGSQKTYAMRLQTLPHRAEGKEIRPQLAEDLLHLSLLDSTIAMLESVGKAPLEQAADHRGLALTSSVAAIEGLPKVVQCKKVYATSKVELMERFHGSLEEVFNRETRMPMSAKLYAARRMLAQVMLLQQAGLSHNNLKLQNFFMRQDGSFYLTDFDASTRIGEPLDRVKGVTLRYAERELAAVAAQDDPDADPPVVHAKSDMWSLGLCLYKILTNGELPYRLDEGIPASRILTMLDQQGIRSDFLLGSLTRAQVPHRWIGLLKGLLEPRREHRLDAEAILVHFADLLD